MLGVALAGAATIAAASPVTLQYVSTPTSNPWLADDGLFIDAHSPNILKDDATSTWYWLGPDYSHSSVGLPVADETFRGVKCYSSNDFANWHFEGFALRPDRLNGDLMMTDIVERPHVVKNLNASPPAGRKYVMWWDLNDTVIANRRHAVAASDYPCGPYNFISTVFLPAPCEATGTGGGDFGLYQDDDASHTAYAMYTSATQCAVYVQQLSADYTAPAPGVAAYAAIRPGTPPGGNADSAHGAAEAPTVFERDGIYYLGVSGTSGWRSNDNWYYTAPNMRNNGNGLWTMGTANNGFLAPRGTQTCNSQLSHFFSIGANYYAIADTWIDGVTTAETPGNTYQLKDSGYSIFPLAFNASNNVSVGTTFGQACPTSVTIDTGVVHRPAPTGVLLKSPSDMAAVGSGAVTLSAAASGAAQVRFYAYGHSPSLHGMTLLGTDTSAPYSLTWTPPSAGAYVLYAIADNGQGKSTTSAAVHVFTSATPMVTFDDLPNRVVEGLFSIGTSANGLIANGAQGNRAFQFTYPGAYVDGVFDFGFTTQPNSSQDVLCVYQAQLSVQSGNYVSVCNGTTTTGSLRLVKPRPVTGFDLYNSDTSATNAGVACLGPTGASLASGSWVVPGGPSGTGGKTTIVTNWSASCQQLRVTFNNTWAGGIDNIGLGPVPGSSGGGPAGSGPGGATGFVPTGPLADFDDLFFRR